MQHKKTVTSITLAKILTAVWIGVSFTSVQATPEPAPHPPITTDNAGQIVSQGYLSRGSVQGLMWSPMGNLLVVPSSLGTWLYNASDFKKPPGLFGNNHNVKATAISQDGNLLASSDSPDPDGAEGRQCLTDTVHVWDIATSQERFTFPTNLNYANTIAFSPDNNFLAVASSYDSVIQLWSLKSGQLQTTLDQGVGTVFGLGFSPDGSTLLSVGGNEKIFVWDMQTKAIRNIFSTESKLILSATFSPDGKQILTGDFDNVFQIREAATGTLVKTFDYKNEGNNDAAFNRTVSYSSDGKWLVAGNHLIKADFDQIIPLPDGIHSAFRPDGKYLIWSTGGDVTLRNLTTGIEQSILDEFSAYIRSLSFGPGDQSIVSIDGRDIRVWKLPQATISRRVIIPDVDAGTISIDRNLTTAASINVNGDKLDLWNVASGTLRFELKIPVVNGNDHSGDVYGPADNVGFTPDGKHLAFASRFDRQIQILDPQTGLVVHTLSPKGDHSPQLAFSADGDVLAALNGNPITLYSVQSGKVIKNLVVPPDPLNEAVSLTISPNGQWAATGYPENVNLWNVRTGQFTVIFLKLGMVQTLNFNPDGSILAAAVNTFYQNPHQCWGTVHHVVALWDTYHNQLLNLLVGHHNQLTALVFSPDGKSLLTGYADGAIEIWAVVPGMKVF